jgi:hypothetical protein
VESYTNNLRSSAIRPSAKEDEIIWSKNKFSKEYTAKLGYVAKIKEI